MRNEGHNKKLLSRFVVITYILMIAVNILAEVLPLNNINTGEIADKYKNLFTPVEYTFLIWFVIYILLGIYTMYQFNFNLRRPDNNDRVVRRVNFYFVLVNIFNILWVFALHYDLILVSLIVMILILTTLIFIRVTISNRSSLTVRERNSIQIPFSIFYGWILFTFIGNVITYLILNNFLPKTQSESGIIVVLIVVGLIAIVFSMFSFKDIVVGIVFIWAYGGIMYRHVSSEYFAGVHNDIIITCGISIVLIVLVMIFVAIGNRRRRRR